ncbi:TPA: hypothetical protein I7155_21320 [Vibrio vulnificus]|nr:hypothetical protein [Vibrio vulnificus]
MKIVCGPAKQVQISNEIKSEGEGENRKQVTYYTHKFLIGEKAYRYKSSGEPLNISDGNIVSLGVMMFGKVGKVYNHTTEEYSHRKPFASAAVSLFIVAIVYLLWVLLLSGLLGSLVPQNIYDLIEYIGYGAIAIIVLSNINGTITYNSLKSALPDS